MMEEYTQAGVLKHPGFSALSILEQGNPNLIAVKIEKFYAENVVIVGLAVFPAVARSDGNHHFFTFGT
jgi:hypothetical protein